MVIHHKRTLQYHPNNHLLKAVSLDEDVSPASAEVGEQFIKLETFLRVETFHRVALNKYHLNRTLNLNVKTKRKGKLTHNPSEYPIHKARVCAL